MTDASGNEHSSLLYAESRWLMRLRWVAAAVTVVGALVDWHWLGWYTHAPGMVGLGAAMAAYNAVLWGIDRASPWLRRRRGALLAFATAQLYLDIACLTVLVLWTGGVRSPLLGFFIFHMVFASLLQPRPRAYYGAAVCLIGMAAGLWMTDQWPTDREAVLIVIGWACTVVVTVYLASRITRGLYRREVARVRQYHRMRALSARIQAQHQTLVQQEKMAAMGQLAAGIAHEITNPLSNMDSVLQLMQRRPEVSRPEAVGSLREQIQRIHGTVRQLTTFAHPGKGKFDLVQVNELVRNSLRMLSLDRRMRKVRVEYALSEVAGEASLNAHAMEQVFANLVRNALDAMENTHEPHLAIRTRREGAVCVIEIADNGCGIAPENLPRVFEPFFTTKPVGLGTGLGLSISVDLVREHGGTMAVESELGRGTTFTIRIPVNNGAPASASAVAVSPSGPVSAPGP